jgi:hypothetical protein
MIIMGMQLIDIVFIVFLLSMVSGVGFSIGIEIKNYCFRVIKFK